MMKDYCGVYSITNKVDGKVYFGSSVRMRTRIEHHKRALNKGNHHSVVLQRAFNKYGNEVFEFKHVLLCSKENRLMYEQMLIDGYKSNIPANGYNMTKYAHAPAPMFVSKEHRNKLSKISRARAKKYEYKGEMLCLSEIAEKANMPFKTLCSRLDDGLSIEQATNKPLNMSRCKKFEHDGKSMTLMQWSKELKISYQRLSDRIRCGWDFYKAITTPVEVQAKLITHNGLTMSISKWAKHCGILQSTLNYRLKHLGWNFEKAISKRSKGVLL